MPVRVSRFREGRPSENTTLEARIDASGERFASGLWIGSTQPPGARRTNAGLGIACSRRRHVRREARRRPARAARARGVRDLVLNAQRSVDDTYHDGGLTQRSSRGVERGRGHAPVADLGERLAKREVVVRSRRLAQEHALRRATIRPNGRLDYSGTIPRREAGSYRAERRALASRSLSPAISPLLRSGDGEACSRSGAGGMGADAAARSRSEETAGGRAGAREGPWSPCGYRSGGGEPPEVVR